MAIETKGNMGKTIWHSRLLHLVGAMALILSFSLSTTVPVLGAPVVASVTETAFNTDTTDHYVGMPATVDEGNLLIVLLVNDRNRSASTPGGWSLLGSVTNGVHVNLSVYCKVADGTEGGTTVNFVTSAAEEATAQVYRITNWHGTTPPEVSTAAAGTDTAPDAPSLNPAGWDVANTLWLAVAGQDRGDQSGPVAYPTSYTDGTTTLSSDGTGSCRVYSARTSLAAASEDPDPFTIPTSEQWVALTIAIRPPPRNLTTSSTAGGSVTTPGEEVFAYDEGTIVDLVAQAEEGWQFLEWTGDVSGIVDVYTSITTITMNGDYSITANFQEIPPVQYNLTISRTEGGSVIEPGEGLALYDEGTVVDLVAQAEEGWQFVEWTGDVGTIADVYAAATTITMNSDYSITANFEEVSTTPVYPTVTTQAATGISPTSATLNMQYSVGNYTSIQVRFVYKKSTDSYWSYTNWASKTADGTHAELVTELNSNTEYEFAAQLKYNDTLEGSVLQFTTATSFTPLSGGGCFIATAAYGTPMAKQIDVLREFRDVVLLESTTGSQFVALYYRLSPPVADFISANSFLRTLVRELVVDPIVWVVEATKATWQI